MENQRRIAADNLPEVGPAADDDLAARRAEDNSQIDWFVQSLHYRYAAYGYALDHLLVETPDPAARMIDTQLAALGSEVGRAAQQRRFLRRAAQRACRVTPRLMPVIPSRFIHGNPTPAAPPPKPAAG